MPFLDRLQRWADERPDDTAVVVAGKRLSWAELRDAAAALVPDAPAVTVLAEGNSTRFVAAFAAAVAGNRRCAVLDPAWPQQLRDALTARIAEAFPAGGTDPGGDPGNDLADGAPDSPFLIGLTSGTTSVPKAFSRSRRSWRLSFDSSVEFFGLAPDDRTLAPGTPGRQPQPLCPRRMPLCRVGIPHPGTVRRRRRACRGQPRRHHPSGPGAHDAPAAQRARPGRRRGRLRRADHHLRRVQARRADRRGRTPLGAERHHFRVLRRRRAQLRRRRRAAAGRIPGQRRLGDRPAVPRRRDQDSRRRRRSRSGRCRRQRLRPQRHGQRRLPVGRRRRGAAVLRRLVHRGRPGLPVRAGSCICWAAART